MPTLDTFRPTYALCRARTLDLLGKLEQEPDPAAALGWRPGPGRAHIAWQLMHIAVTEDLFASERLAPHKSGNLGELWPRFRGGSTPDDQIPTAAEIRAALERGRAGLLETLGEFGEDRLDEVPAALAARKLSIRDVLSLLVWHEAHHQGQCHLTYNLWKHARS